MFGANSNNKRLSLSSLTLPNHRSSRVRSHCALVLGLEHIDDIDAFAETNPLVDLIVVLACCTLETIQIQRPTKSEIESLI